MACRALLTVLLRVEKSNSNSLPEIRKARVGQDTGHSLAQRQTLIHTRLRRKQTYLALEESARVVAQGPSFQVFQE